MIVVDSSALLDYLLGAEPNASWVSSQLRGGAWDLHAPHIVDVEVAGVVRRSVLSGSVSAGRGGAAIDVLLELPLRRYPHVRLLRRAWELRSSIHVPDAMFVALAEALDAPLVTTDSRLARSHGHRAEIVAP